MIRLSGGLRPGLADVAEFVEAQLTGKPLTESSPHRYSHELATTFCTDMDLGAEAPLTAP